MSFIFNCLSLWWNKQLGFECDTAAETLKPQKSPREKPLHGKSVTFDGDLSHSQSQGK